MRCAIAPSVCQAVCNACVRAPRALAALAGGQCGSGSVHNVFWRATFQKWSFLESGGVYLMVCSYIMLAPRR